MKKAFLVFGLACGIWCGVAVVPLRAEVLLNWVSKDFSLEEFPKVQAALQAETRDLNLIRDPNGKSLLHWAAHNGHCGCITLFLLRGLDPNVRDNKGATPLLEAAGLGRSWEARLLLLKGADPNLADFQGNTPLSAAVQAGDEEMAELLLWVGAKPTDVLVQADGKKAEVMKALLASYTEAANPVTLASQPRKVPAFVEKSLHRAAKREDFESLQRLLDAGVDVNSRDEKGFTALHRAVEGNRAETIFYLLMMGANPEVADDKGVTPLMQTMYWHGWGMDRYQDMFLLTGASRFSKNKAGKSVFMYAVSRGNGYGMRMLAGLGADLREVSPEGTPLEVAFKEGNEPIIKLLREYGVTDPLPVISDPVWNYHNAVKRGLMDKVKESLAAGVKVDAPDQKGNSALINAIYSQKLEVARFLMSQGADLSYRNPETHVTPAWATAVWDYHEMTLFREELLKAGAAVNVPSKSGMTPLSRGMAAKPNTICRQFIKYGADINFRNHKGMTPVGIAREHGNLAFAEWLVSLGGKE